MSKALMYVALQAIGQYNTGDKIPAITDDELQTAIKDSKAIEGLPKARADFLIKKGAIEEVESEAEAVDGDTNEGDTGEVVKLDKLTKAELTALLDEEGIEYNESDTKAELIALFPKD